MTTVALTKRHGLKRSIGVALLIWAIAGGVIYSVHRIYQSMELPELPIPAVADIIERQPADQAHLLRVVDSIDDQHPNLAFSVSGDLVTITSPSHGDYAEWLIAISRITASDAKLRWQTKSICVGTGCGRDVLRMTLTAERISIVQRP